MSFFGTNIKKIRQVKGLSQKAFADLFDLNRGVISAYEEGRAEPKIDTLLKVAGYFSLDINDFLTKPLQVNNLVSGSVIDTLMFSPLEKLSAQKKTVPISTENDENSIVLQKILANTDKIFEFTENTSLIPNYRIGDCLFLVKENSENRQETLLTIENGNLRYLSEIPEKKRAGKTAYSIAGYFSFKQKNILSVILERIAILEKK